MMDGLSIKVKNYACFGEEPQGFDSIKPINILIGKNNSGKSRFVDIIPKLEKSHMIYEDLEIIVSYPFNVLASAVNPKIVFKDHIIKVKTSDTGGYSTGAYEFIEKNIFNRRIVTSKNKDGYNFTNFDPPLELNKYIIEGPLGIKYLEEYFKDISHRFINPLYENAFVILRAERNVKAETIDVMEPKYLGPTGSGASTSIRSYLLDITKNHELVEKIILEKLNEIVEPDMRFTNITIRDDYKARSFEIHLGEENKPLVPLSLSGSGIQTILLVLIYTIIIPYETERRDGREYKQFIFSFEELENNLHPAMQRRLYQYIRKLAEEKGATFFLTTHSSIAIDQFINDDLAQIYHIYHDGKNAVIKQVEQFDERGLILDDLGIRASDVLQSNGIIWVEGPSDRIYINKWIDLWSDSEIKENVHYHCLFYGGAGNLKHLSADSSRDTSDLINILSLNRNAVIVIDSDRSEGEEIDSTRRRILEEVESNDRCFVWITQGREIENYIPKSAISDFLHKEVEKEVGQFQEFKKYYKEITRTDFDKVQFAKRVRNHLTKVNCNRLDLDEKINKIITTINKWNSSK